MTPAKNVTVQAVKFFVNDTLVGQDADGPVYAVEWVDDNPFGAAAIAVEAIDAVGRAVRDTVKLAPFEFVETAEVLSVLLEATVQDATGRFVGGMSDSGFVLTEDGVRQHLDVVRPELLPATYTLLVDSSQSMARRVDFLREAAARLSTPPAPAGPDAGRAVLARRSGRSPARPATVRRSPKRSPRSSRAAAPPLPTRWPSTAKLISGIEGRHAIVLLTRRLRRAQPAPASRTRSRRSSGRARPSTSSASAASPASR